MISLVEVERKNIAHIKILFEFLKKKKYNISHNDVIDFGDHSHFVSKHPYRKWFLIKYQNRFMGSIYVTYENTIGINIINYEERLLKECLNNLFKIIKPLPPLPSIRNKNFLINISPENEFFKKFLQRLGSTKIQETYVINDI